MIKLIVTEQNILFQALGGNKQALEEAATVSDWTCLGTVSWVCSQIQPMDAYYGRGPIRVFICTYVPMIKFTL